MKTALIVLASFLYLSTLVTTASAEGTWKTENHSGIYGNRNYKVYIPKVLNKNFKTPVVIMLHGCQQNAQDFATGTRIEKWADKEQFIAVFPEQNIAYNPFKCWNWILPTNNSRMGESKIIVEILDVVLLAYNGDSNRVYAAGMSAGGTMVNILGNCFPERFKALASHDGSQFYSSYLGLDFAEVVLTGASVPSGIAASVGNVCSQFAKNRPIFKTY